MENRRVPTNIYEVIVGNVGTVYRGDSLKIALADYLHYVNQSRTNPGNRCYGESVTLMFGSEIEREYQPDDKEECTW